MLDYFFETQVSPLFFNFELPVTYLMATISIMQPNPAPDNPLIYTEQQRQQSQNSSNIWKTTANYQNWSARSDFTLQLRNESYDWKEYLSRQKTVFARKSS